MANELQIGEKKMNIFEFIISNSTVFNQKKKHQLIQIQGKYIGK
jgi:hypothetical protein